SRNQYLTAAERGIAPLIHQQLQRARSRLLAGANDADVEAEGLAALIAAGFRPDYFTVRDTRDLQPALPDTRELVVLVAARLGKAGLSENLRVTRRPRPGLQATILGAWPYPSPSIPPSRFAHWTSAPSSPWAFRAI